MGHFDAAAQATPATAMRCSIHATEVGMEAAKTPICKENTGIKAEWSIWSKYAVLYAPFVVDIVLHKVIRYDMK